MSRKYSCIASTTRALPWPCPTEIQVFGQQRGGCCCWWRKTFKQVVSISFPFEQWKVLLSNRFENSHTVLRANFKRLAAWRAQDRPLKVKIKVKVGTTTVHKHVLCRNTIFTYVQGGDFDLQANITEEDLLNGLSVCLVKRLQVQQHSPDAAS